MLDGILGSTHCMELPFVFDNVELHRTLTGGCPDDIELGHRISRLWSSFATDGKPAADGMPEWEPYPACLLLNTESELITN